MYTIIEVPYHMGMEEVATGKGPAALLRAGIDQLLAEAGMPPTVVHIRPRDLRNKGLDAVIDINRMLRYAVKEAVEQETVPFVLAGNCNSALGTLAALDTSRLGVVWLDKHPDFHTPETSISGNLEGMTLAAITGGCHADLRERIGMDPAIEEQNVVLVGVDDIEDGERERLAESWVSVHPADSLSLLPVALDQLRERVDGIYLHIDTDFLSGVEDPVKLIGLIRESVTIVAVGVTNYNPEFNSGGAWAAEIAKVVGALRVGKVN